MAKKILIVEDEEYIAEMYRLKFCNAGFDVIIAEDGQIGLEKAVSECPDLILLDLVLPKLDGFKVLEEIRNNPKTKKLKVYILSNLGQHNEANDSLGKGADGFIVKSSLTPAQLLEKIKSICEGCCEEKVIQTKKAEQIEKKVEKKIGKVLIVEDEEAILEIFKLRLEKDGFEVELARNGVWGVKLANEKVFDTIVMDVVMPAMNGYEAMKQIRKNGKNKKTPILVLSNSAQDDEIEGAKKMGATEYFLKSQVTPSELSKKIKRILKIN